MGFGPPSLPTNDRASVPRQCSCTTVFVLTADGDSEAALPKLRFDENENPITLGYKEYGAFPPKKALPTPADTPKPASNFYEQAASAV
jgi:hypothetical protein